MASVGRQGLLSSTLCEEFQRTAKVDPEAVALRTVAGTQQITWREYANRVRRIATGLASLGVGHGDTVALMMGNRPEFNLIDTAILHLGAGPFSIYNTNSAEQIAHLLSNAESKVVFCEARFVDTIRAAGGPVETIVVIDAPVGGTLPLKLVEERSVPDFDFDASWRAVRPTDVATLIYTSGTTGNPKGVELTHANILSQVEALSHVFDVKAGDRFVSFLPAAHIADRLASHYLQIAHGTQLTTLDDPKNLAAALADARPTYWFAVPRVWEKLKAALELGFAEADGVKATLLARARTLSAKNVEAGRGGPTLSALEQLQLRVLDHIVLSKVRAKLGLEELRWAISGGASIAPDTLNFFLALGIKVCEIWGMSETAGAGLVNPPDGIRSGTIGKPLPGVEVRVADDGEMLIRGGIVMRGYRSDPERTAEALDADGWLYTGDVVNIDADGYVTIVDRKKELIINAAGKNMSPANIEGTLKTMCPLIGEAVTIGDGRPFNTALIVLDADAAAAYAAKKGLSDASAAALAVDPDLVQTILAGVAAANARLSRVEQIKRLRILPVFWEPGGVEITPTMKLRRRPISERYTQEIESLYADPIPAEVHALGTPADPAHRRLRQLS
ncbi:AMP-dependent synthetase [Rhodococcus sp. SC4]|uniref:AMP-binding protein n=1 Tax=Rhodococcus sp. ACPA1 TaxID=2028572 RepID=UPI00076A9F00|nr:AMP-binding protein [Rhodococcus sp. ACPA1]KXF53835.1 AMP-dependent synthetase [Rhodococcus sp. SC4]PBC58011.1 long-chain fatty acid--CoA ligase [Rhodococcus sp. ACPA1]